MIFPLTSLYMHAASTILDPVMTMHAAHELDTLRHWLKIGLPDLRGLSMV